ncbi:uncharacterized protein LOC143427578 [Xylocopa sonorina]|uniref:uncharacterized protein LOC143427578 n=1 Tax=Xylocopa sonorina TaxID=1818115 RepID=UPI00403A8694
MVVERFVDANASRICTGVSVNRLKMYSCRTFIDPVVKCPYYDNHFIAKSRLQKHIVKCEKRYNGDFRAMCPFNATHRLVKEDLKEHITTCPSRNVFNSEMYPEPTKHGATNFNLHSEISSTIDSTENWDTQVDDSSTISASDVYYAHDNIDSSRRNLDLMTPRSTPETILKETYGEHKPVRAPRGFSEAMMIEASEDSCIEDLESISSSMGIGRGKVTWESKLKLIGLGRGQSLKKDF